MNTDYLDRNIRYYVIYYNTLKTEIINNRITEYFRSNKV